MSTLLTVCNTLLLLVVRCIWCFLFQYILYSIFFLHRALLHFIHPRIENTDICIHVYVYKALYHRLRANIENISVYNAE